MEEHRRLILADDLTGSNDSGVHLLSMNETVTVIADTSTGLPALSSVNTAINTDTRFQTPKNAAEIVGRIYQNYRQTPKLSVYKKIDSTLRGNIGAELDALLQFDDFDVVCLTTASPDLGRTVIDGTCIVDGIPVSETELGKDPFHPVVCSSIAEVIESQSRFKVGNLLLKHLESSESALQELTRLLEKKTRIVVVDGTERRHLQLAIRAFRKTNQKVLFAGAAGLFNSMFDSRKKPALNPENVGRNRNALVILGSLMPRSRRQLEVLDQTLKMDLLLLSEDAMERNHEGEIGRVLMKLQRSLETCQVTSLTTRPSASTTKVTPEIMSRSIGSLVSMALTSGNVDLIVLVGGDTALGVLKSVGINTLQLAYEVLPGVAMSSGTLPNGRPLTIVTKSGSFGDDDVLIRILEGVRFEFSV